MNRVKKWTSITAALFLMVVSILIVGFNLKPINANAQIRNFTVEEYTNDDRLLKSDGQLSVRTIRNFANDVNAGYSGQEFPELAQVVPLEYLESTENTATFAYNGKEYGFYMAKEGEHFDLLLIDFVYEFDDADHTNNEYKIRIKPILQTGFSRSSTEDGYVWEKTDPTYTYYVANPRFLSVVQNENALNYGDAGYSKTADGGVIIAQSRTNYGKISYKTEDDLLAACTEFLADQLLSAVVSILDEVTYGLASLVKDLIIASVDIYEAGQEETVFADNEENIFTQQSKSEQLKNEKGGFSRSAFFVPKTEIVLSAADDSYAEFITVLNETNYKTRLTQYCEFDIVRRSGRYSSMEEVNDPDKGEFYSFTKERILFSEGSEKSLAFDEPAATYNLPHGTDCFKFTPAVSGTYTFTADDDRARLSLYTDPEKTDGLFEEKASASVYLQGGTNYLLDASMTGENAGSYEITVTAGTWAVGTDKANQPIPANGQLYKITAAQKGGYQIAASNPDIRFRLYDADMRYLYESETNRFSQYFASGDTYYLWVYSITNTAQTATLSFSEAEAMEQGEEYAVPENYPVMYKFSAPGTAEGKTYYSIVFKNVGDDFEADIFGYTGTIDYASSADFQSMSLYLLPGEEIYIQIADSGTFTVKVDQAQNLIAWVVNGEEQETNTVCLQRGKQWEIGLKIDGIAVNNVIYSSDMLLENGKILDLTDYEKISDPTDESTYLYFYAIQNNSPIPLKVCVLHDFEFVFDSYNDNSGYGFQWETTSSDDKEFFTIRYEVTAGSKTKEKETAPVRVGSKESIMACVKNEMKYTKAQDVSIEIISAVFWIEDDKVATIYNSTYEENTEQDSRALYQNFSCEKFLVNPLFAGGSGTMSDPHQIANERHLNNIREVYIEDNFDNTVYVYGHYILTENITMKNPWKPLDEGKDYFAGSINGNNKTISGIKISAVNKNTGFIANNYADISDLTLSNVNISVSSTSNSVITSVGAVAGYNHVTIKNVSVINGTITGTGRSIVGGIVGGTDFGRIENCRAGLTIKGGYITGGIIGSCTISVVSCKFTGTLVYATKNTDHDAVGGIAGTVDDGGVVKDCTYTGLIRVDVRDWNSKTLQPYIGGLIGHLHNGKQSGNIEEGEFIFHNLNIDNDQQKYCSHSIGKNDCE